MKKILMAGVVKGDALMSNSNKFVQEAQVRYLGHHGPCHLRDSFPAIRAIVPRPTNPHTNIRALIKRGHVRRIPGAQNHLQTKYELTAEGRAAYGLEKQRRNGAL